MPDRLEIAVEGPLDPQRLREAVSAAYPASDHRVDVVRDIAGQYSVCVDRWIEVERVDAVFRALVAFAAKDGLTLRANGETELTPHRLHNLLQVLQDPELNVLHKKPISISTPNVWGHGQGSPGNDDDGDRLDRAPIAAVVVAATVIAVLAWASCGPGARLKRDHDAAAQHLEQFKNR